MTSLLVRVATGWYESRDGRYAIVRSARGDWHLASHGGEGWFAERFRSKQDAAVELARRLELEVTES